MKDLEASVTILDTIEEKSKVFFNQQQELISSIKKNFPNASSILNDTGVYPSRCMTTYRQ